MPDESLEERTVEVLALSDDVDEELLCLFFENKRRSGGGPLVSVEKKGTRAILVFEEAEAAARVLSKGHHVVHNVELSVRKPASKDPCRLLLRGTNPTTCTEMLELYVENMMGVIDYTLHHSPGRDLILIHLSQPFSKDLQNLSAKISKRKLDGATVSLEQVDETDTVLVENLHPGTTTDQITVYFESDGGGNQQVKEVTMLSEDTARVSFVNYKSVDIVRNHTHKLDAADLLVTPYFDFLHATKSGTPPEAGIRQQATPGRSSEDAGMQTNPPEVVNASSQLSPQTAPFPAPRAGTAKEAMETETREPATVDCHIAVADPVKLYLFQLSTLKQDIEKAHPDFTIQLEHNGVHIAGTGRGKSEPIKQTISDFFDKLAEVRFTLEPEKAQFLARKDVRERLLQTMTQTGLPSMYTVSDCNVVVASLSQHLANQTCSFLKTQLCSFSMQVDMQYECMFYCNEWSDFLQALDFSSVKVAPRGEYLNVLTLKGMESEKESAILQFLSTPIERETIIPMEPGVLKYIQTHCHQLLADMDQVSIFPLEAGDICGFKIQGQAIACQMAEEVLQGVVSSVCTRTITVNTPGVTRFFCDEECQSILKEIEKKFTVYISVEHVPWQPTPFENILEGAWTMMSNRNFSKVVVDGSAQEIKPESMQTNDSGAADKGLLEEAKRIVSTIDGRPVDSDQLDDIDNLDLYTAEEPTSSRDSDVMVLEAPQSLAEEKPTSLVRQLSAGAVGLSNELEEEAQLSLAIQYSMESSHWSLEDEEEQLQKALELSKQMIQADGSSSSEKNLEVDYLQKGDDVSLQESIKAANTMKLFVFAGYSCDLIRTDIAFGKKVSQRQVEEKVEHRCLRNLSEYHRRVLDLIKRKHAVEIQIQGTIITVSGFQDYVHGGVWDVKLLLEQVESYVPDRDILKSVQWLYHDLATSDAIPYPPSATVFIENIWRKKAAQINILLDNQAHIIDFEKMQEIHKASGKSVKVSRKLLSLKDMAEEMPEEELSLLSNLPEASKVDEESDEFQNVVKCFYETIKEYHSKIRIIQVEKLMNRLLYNQYKLKKVSVLQQASYPEIERTLYHGTAETSVKEICVHGFNRSFCGKNATVYGQGVYFAVNSALSVQDQYSPPNADGYKFIFVSKVLTGDYTKGCHSMKTAPLKETGDIPLRYDSVTDDITKPSMFVIFNDTQAFPEYLITCQRIQR